MAQTPTAMRVRAVDGRKLPAIDPSGRPIPGRFVGYDRDGKPMPDGDSVACDTYHQRAVRRGDLERFEPTEEPPPAADAAIATE